MTEDRKNILGRFIVFLLIIYTYNLSYADNESLEITNDGRVSLNAILHLSPQDSPPANPVDGDIYLNSAKTLLLFSDGKWTKVKNSPYEWEIGTWGDCHAEDDSCLQSRTAICKQIDGDQQVADNLCGPKPATRQPCRTYACKVCKHSASPALYYWMQFGTYPSVVWNAANSSDNFANINPGATSFVVDGYKYTKGALISEAEPNSYINVKVSTYEVCRELP